MSDAPPSPAVTDEQDVAAISITVRYFAAARAAAGVDDEELPVRAPATVATVIDAMRARHGDSLARVLARCSYLLGGVAVRETGRAVVSGDEIDVLPPFAGG